MSISNHKKYPWTRRVQETDLAFNAFSIYRDQGAARSLAKTASLLGKKSHYTSQLEKWSKKYQWISRCALYDDYRDLKKLECADENLAQLYKHTLEQGFRVVDELITLACNNSPCKPERLRAIEIYFEVLGLKNKQTEDTIKSLRERVISFDKFY